nr:STK_08120 family protein [Saccharolobus solfataricus]
MKEGDFTAEVPLSALLGKATIVIYGKVFRSLNSITYVINVAGYGPDKGGKIRVQLEKGKIIIDVEFNIPLGFLNARLIKSRIADFKNKANELIRLERIKRKI